MREFEPRRPAVLATLVFLAAGLLLFWPILTGQFLPGDDQILAGYGFRLFGAEYFREYGKIPLWNPYVFGGLPFVAAMHGDIFYPTAWLRWIVPTDVGMNIGFAAHIVIAGCTMYALLRALGAGWGGAIAGGISYELSGLVAGMVSPGHDGKLFVAALAPLLLLSILRAVRDGRTSAYGLMAITVGLALHGHPQMSYYLLIVALLWGLWLLFLSPERPAANRRLKVALGAMGAVALGFGLYMIQALPFIQYIPFSPRAEGGTSGNWDYATGFSFPPSELWSVFYPEFNGIQPAYWGVNFFKTHTEFIGLIPLALAWLGIRDKSSPPACPWIVGNRRALPAGGVRRPYAVLPALVRADADDEEGARARNGFPLHRAADLCIRGVRRGSAAQRRGDFSASVDPGRGLRCAGTTGRARRCCSRSPRPSRFHEQMQRVLANADGLRAGGVRVTIVASGRR